MLTLTGNVVIGTIDARAAGCSDEVVIYDSIMILGSSSISASRAYPPLMDNVQRLQQLVFGYTKQMILDAMQMRVT